MRKGGVSGSVFRSLNLANHVGDEHKAVSRNRRILFSQVGLSSSALLYCRQVHSSRVVLVRPNDSISDIFNVEADALISLQAGLVLAVFTADCVPIFILDIATPAIGLIHAGWRGTLDRIAERTIQAMHQHFGTIPSKCLAYLGPSIQRCCYTVSKALADRFEEAHDVSVRCSDNRISLQVANIQQLNNVGVLSDSISMTACCTACRTDLFYSHRVEGARSGRMISFMALSRENSGNRIRR